MPRLVVDLSTEQHHALKLQALQLGKTLSDYAKAYLFRVPNAETMEALDDLQTGKNVETFGASAELFNTWK